MGRLYWSATAGHYSLDPRSLPILEGKRVTVLSELRPEVFEPVPVGWCLASHRAGEDGRQDQPQACPSHQLVVPANRPHVRLGVTDAAPARGGTP